jgi:hypothetical protein
MAQIRPNRLEVSDRFPMLGFTIRTDGPPVRAEVAVATNPALFLPENKSKRTLANFYSSRAGTALAVPRREAVYLLPPEVLARFLGQERLYVALATAQDGNGGSPRIDVLPTEASPYISLKGLTERSLRRVRMVPSRQRRAAGYGQDGPAALDWAGDAAAPGTRPAEGGPTTAPSPDSQRAEGGNGKGSPPRSEYDDGFGPLSPPAGPSPEATKTPPPAGAKALDLAGVVVSGERTPVLPPAVTRISGLQPGLAENVMAALGGPLAPRIASLPAAARAAGVSIGIGSPAGKFPDAGFGTGAVFGPDGGLGVYGGVEFQESLLTAIGTIARITVVAGGIENFSSCTLAAPISGAEPAGVPFALFDSVGAFQGVTFELIAGADISPVDVFVAARNRVPVQSAPVQPAGLPSARIVARAASAEGEAPGDPDAAHGIDEPIPDETAGAAGLAFVRPMEQAPEYPGASRFVPAATNNYRAVSGQRTIDRIVIHINDGGSKIEGTIGWFKNRNQKKKNGDPINVSAHYVIGQDGEIVQMVKHNDIAWHAGSANSSSIGIEHIANPRGLDPTEVQYEASAGLVAWLCDTYGIPIERSHILGHAEADPKTTHACPGKIWDWDHYMELVSARASQTAETPSSEGQAVTRPMGEQSFSINWDEVELIAQPTDMSCWATAAAMVVGWRDQICLTPESVASICNRVLEMEFGLAPSKIGKFANEMGLVAEQPQCYTEEGFRQLLENNGPLWIAAAVPFLHAIVVTGMYCDGDGTYVRVTDPLDRVVGIPGAPGPRTEPYTHFTGSRYIMKWEDFTREYETGGTKIKGLQILHSGGTGGRIPNYGKAAGYALSLADAPALDPSSLLISGERSAISPPSVKRLGDAQKIALQAALAALSGPLAPTVLALPAMARAAGVSIGLGPAVSAGLVLGGSIGAGIIFGSDGGLGLYGMEELDVGILSSIGAAIQVTVVRGGIESFNGYGFAAAITIDLGAKIGGAALFDRDADFVGVTMQVGVGVGFLPVDVYFAVQRQVAVQIALAQVKAATLASTGRKVPRAPAPATRGRAAPPRERVLAAGANPSSRRREAGSWKTVTWEFDQYDGLRYPAGRADDGTTPTAERAVSIDDWPYVPSADGRTQLPVTVAWRYANGAVGDVRVKASSPSASPEWSLRATADIAEGPDAANASALRVTVRYNFGRAGVVENVAVTELVLYGDGTYQRQDRWEQAAAAVAA